MWRQLRKNWFRSGDMNVTWNLAAPEANLCGSSTNIAVLKNFATFTEKDLCTSLFLKHATLLEKRPWHKCFPFNSKKTPFLQNPLRRLLLLLGKLPRKHTYKTCQMNVGAMVGKQSKEMYFSKVSDLYQQLNSVGSIFQQFYSLNIQNIFPWPLLIYIISAIVISLLLKYFNHKNRRCKYCTTFTIFTKISCEEISHIGQCSEVL